MLPIVEALTFFCPSKFMFIFHAKQLPSQELHCSDPVVSSWTMWLTVINEMEAEVTYFSSGHRWLRYQSDFILSSWSWIDEEGSEPLEDEKGITWEEHQFQKFYIKESHLLPKYPRLTDMWGRNKFCFVKHFYFWELWCSREQYPNIWNTKF